MLSLVPWEHAGARPCTVEIGWLLRRDEEGGERDRRAEVQTSWWEDRVQARVRAYKRASTSPSQVSAPPCIPASLLPFRVSLSLQPYLSLPFFSVLLFSHLEQDEAPTGEL
jgi:hypothetical protein